MKWYGYEQIFGPWCALSNFTIVKVEQEGQILKAYIAEVDNEIIGVFHFGFTWAHRHFWDHYVSAAVSALAFPITIPYPNLYQGKTEGPTQAGSSLHPFPCVLGDVVDYMLLTNGGHLNVASMVPPTFEFLGRRKDIQRIEDHKNPC